MPVTVLSGGVGAARFLAGLVEVVDPGSVTAVVNVGDDEWINGLRVCADLDTVTYTLAGAIDPVQGWGLSGESWVVMESLRRYASSAQRPDVGWFNLGDRDLGTHLWRTTRLAEGAPLSAVTAEIASAWGVTVRLLPVTDHPLATRLRTGEGAILAFQEYFVREQHEVSVAEVVFAGADESIPAPGVLAAIEQASTVVIAPSNPIVSIGPLLSVPGVRAAVTDRRSSCVAISPIVGGRALKGPADRLLAELGHDVSVVGVARLYRSLASVLVIDEVDADLAPAVESEGMRCVITRTVMSQPGVGADLARACLSAVGGASPQS